VIGVGIETADMLVQEVLSRHARSTGHSALRRATGSPDESGRKRREKGLARSGNAQGSTRHDPIGGRFLMFQKDSTLAQWSSSAPRTPRQRSATIAGRSWRAKLLRQGAVLLEHEKSPRQLDHASVEPERLPERASPFSRRFLPLSSASP